jgi:hypothetical protein
MICLVPSRNLKVSPSRTTKYDNGSWWTPFAYISWCPGNDPDYVLLAL